MEEFYPSTPGGWSPWSCQTPMACCHVFRPFLCCWMPRSIPPSHDQGRWGSRSGLKLPPSICLLHKKVLGKVSRRWIRKKKQGYFLNSDVQLCNSSIEHHPGPHNFPCLFFSRHVQKQSISSLQPSWRNRMLSIWSWCSVGLSWPLSVASGFFRYNTDSCWTFNVIT